MGRIRAPIIVLIVLIVLLAGVPITAGQEDGTVTLDFVPYEGNPIIPRGADGDWDAVLLWTHVFHHDGLFHMFYLGADKDFRVAAIQVGYATSEDGVNWTKYEGNPVLSLDPDVAAYGAGPVQVYIEDDTWVMVIIPRLHFGNSPGLYAQRATAPEPTGPWEVDETVLFERGSGSDWDTDGPYLLNLVQTTDGYYLYYSAGPIFGLVTSPDGLTWTKYNDPETEQTGFRNSDPVFVRGERGQWDEGFVNGVSAWQSDQGWEMIYSGGSQAPGEDIPQFGFGYATSDDGITWTRHGDAPFLDLGSGIFTYTPNVVVVDNTVYLYYTTGTWGDFWEHFDIGVAIGTITHN